MVRSDLLAFLRSRPNAVEASVNPDGSPQAAIVGVAVLDDFSVVFDTVAATRKAANLTLSPRVAFVFGSLEAESIRTAQYQGVAEVMSGTGPDLAAIEAYLRIFPDGRERQAWPGFRYYRVIPTWIRYSDWTTDPPIIEELDAAQIASLE